MEKVAHMGYMYSLASHPYFPRGAHVRGRKRAGEAMYDCIHGEYMQAELLKFELQMMIC